MRDLEATFAEMLETLRQARDAVHTELELLHAQEFDRQSALRILDAAQNFADQAQALVLMMTDKGAEPALLKEANQLAASFWQTEETIEAMLGLEQG